MSRSKISISLVALLALLVIQSAEAAPGALDPSFGAAGKVTTAIGSGNEGIDVLALQPDGKLVAAGYSNNGSNDDFALARYNPDGTLDPVFGSGGKVTTANGPSDDEAYALALQPDGKVVAAGYGSNGSQFGFALARYNPDGTLDPTFGSGGKVVTAIGSVGGARALALQPDGKLVAAGWSDGGSNYDFTLARYNPDGSLDSGFGSGGVVTTAIGSGWDVAYALVLQPDGKLVAAGDSDNGSNHDFALARYNPNGTLDSGFGSGGVVTTAIGSGWATAYALALQPDGRLVAAGKGWDGTKSHFGFALARYDLDGTLDSTFGSGGKVTTAIGSFDDGARALAPQPDGRLLAAGNTWNGSNYDVALARYKTDGSLDKRFNETGKVTTAIGSANDVANALALQPDGKLVAAGYSDGGSNYDFALARYRVSGTLTVARRGSGSGSVTSSPAGINCGPTCSAKFAIVPVTLTATPASGSSFTGWAGACSGTGSCTVTMGADRTVTATFAALCVVPKVRGMTLRAAKRTIRGAHCSVGKVTYAFSAKVKKGRVISTKPKPGATRPTGWKVGLTVSKGKRAA